MVDPRGGGASNPNSLIFMQLSAKDMQNSLVHSSIGSWRPLENPGSATGG